MKTCNIIILVPSMLALNAELFGVDNANEPSVQSLFSAGEDMVDAAGPVDQTVLENLFGFPFWLDGVDEWVYR